jgi:hypothetical protein
VAAPRMPGEWQPASGAFAQKIALPQSCHQDACAGSWAPPCGMPASWGCRVLGAYGYEARGTRFALSRWSWSAGVVETGAGGGRRMLLNTDPSAVLSYLRLCLDAVSVAGTASSRGWTPSRPIRICEETLLAPHPLLRWPAGLAHRQTVVLRRAATSPGSHYPLSSTGPLPLHCS